MNRYDPLAELLEYPGPEIVALAEAARHRFTVEIPLAADRIAQFAAFAAGQDPAEREELYTRTFELSAPCSLEVGWHIFGETYKRGAFLVRLRLAAQFHGVVEGSELPDHLAIVLRLLGRLTDEEEPKNLVEEAVLPALAKMIASLRGDADHPYRALLEAVEHVLCADFQLARVPCATRLPMFSPSAEGSAP